MSDQRPHHELGRITFGHREFGRSRYGLGRRRRGVSLVEILVSGVMLMTVMSIVGTVRFRLNGVWRDIRHQQIGVGELSNQLDRLTAMPIEQLRSQIESLEPSAPCRRVLRQATLTGDLVADQNLGQRLTLKLDWDRGVRGKPVELSGWLVDSKPDTSPAVEASP